MTSDNAHFERIATWNDASTRCGFTPRQPHSIAGASLRSLQLHVRDHRGRLLAAAEQTLEAHFGSFVLSQSRCGATEARRKALDVRYGRDPRAAIIGTHDARVYELGAPVSPDDPDGRAPAVIAWADADCFLFLASGSLAMVDLLEIASSIYLHQRPP